MAETNVTDRTHIPPMSPEAEAGGPQPLVPRPPESGWPHAGGPRTGEVQIPAGAPGPGAPPESGWPHLGQAPAAEVSAGPTDLAKRPPELPPRHPAVESGHSEEDTSHPVHYIRDPHKLVGYLVPFPKPVIKGVSDPSKIPERFLIYTPPPPPLQKPKEGEKEGKIHKVQRKWQEEVRSAKESDAKLASWHGVKSRATKGINTAIGWTKTSNLEFLNRFPGASSDDSPKAAEAHQESTEKGKTFDQTSDKKTVGLDELILIHPSTLPGPEARIREEFVNTMLRTKSKAQRDAVIATGLLPVAYGIDILATLIWPFGGLGEIDTVWAYASLRGAKTARSVTKRLASSGTATDGAADPNPTDEKKAEQDLQSSKDSLKLTFAPSPRLDVLSRMLQAECHRADRARFPSTPGPEPTDTEALAAIGWKPSVSGAEERNWEDEQWQTREVKEDLRDVMKKGAKEWSKWSAAFEKDPDKAVKK